MIPNMGWHFLNAKVTGFDSAKPPILVYEKRGSSMAARRARVGVHGEAEDAAAPGRQVRRVRRGVPLRGRHVRARRRRRSSAPKTSPQSGAKFGFWHPNLVTLHVWLWYPNPSGLFAGTNPLVTPFNGG